ncbi:uncharacterized protein BJ212DRAFT_544330 [Suillus subaureus]|uniref:Uncharacterized protein n=1 Tax=Suillus subaureus TaxID=48587 RepID=A0A9P7EKQ5_9AGAM|nr:uncharacterized protein BJ212DRAFT_544330 [Suillus subaureus]KAG1824737.1 hypothetical protein BJ212DRAFT_544330 [Suillus subaureus]
MPRPRILFLQSSNSTTHIFASLNSFSKSVLYIVIEDWGIEPLIEPPITILELQDCAPSFPAHFLSSSALQMHPHGPLNASNRTCPELFSRSLARAAHLIRQTCLQPSFLAPSFSVEHWLTTNLDCLAYYYSVHAILLTLAYNNSFRLLLLVPCYARNFPAKTYLVALSVLTCGTRCLSSLRSKWGICSLPHIRTRLSITFVNERVPVVNIHVL